MTGEERFDVVVVGAGPGGSIAARAAARAGARTLLVDQRPELGYPVQCGEYLPTPAELETLFPCEQVIRDAFPIPSEVVERALSSICVLSPRERRFEFPMGGCSVSRRAFDKWLAHDAERAGAELRYPCGVTGVRSGEVELAGGKRVKSRVVIGADGPLSTVARCSGFRPRRELFRMITATAEGLFAGPVELFFGSVAPGGYAWVIPKRAGANVGLGVSHLPPGMNLDRLLDRFLQRQGLGTGVDRTRWWVPVGPPPESAVRGSALFVGDAANLVMATNGGGIPTAMLSGWAAGTAAVAYVRDGRPLSVYDEIWKPLLFEPLARAYRIEQWGARIVHHDRILETAMRLIGVGGLESMIRLHWPLPGFRRAHPAGQVLSGEAS